jgi:large subunit ribosomal protein L29
MKIKEIREKETTALTHELAEAQKHLYDLRSQAVTEKLEDPSQLMKTKRSIARIKTILRQRQIEQEQEKAPSTEPAKPAKPAKSGKPVKSAK